MINFEEMPLAERSSGQKCLVNQQQFEIGPEHLGSYSLLELFLMVLEEKGKGITSFKGKRRLCKAAKLM